ncbi:MAG TPA: ribonuclease HII [Anaerolineae bacterium]
MAGKGERAWPGVAYETEVRTAGYRIIAGLDEAGRGAWAGPVVAAAVILPQDAGSLAHLIGRVDDSKRLTPPARERLYDAVLGCALAAAVGSVANDAIDAIGILPATRLAMEKAIAGLALRPDYLLLDFLTLPAVSLPQRGIVHGDGLSISIAAASIVAKVSRDRWMAEQARAYPGYRFERHKGYGTAEHQEALRRLGPCELHRRSFRPLIELSSDADDESPVCA